MPAYRHTVVEKHISFSCEKKHRIECVCVSVCVFGHNYSILRNQKVQLNNEYAFAAFAFPWFSSHRSGQQARLQKAFPELKFFLDK